MNINMNLKEILLVSEQLSLINTQQSINTLKKIKNTLEKEGYKNESIFISDLMGNKSFSFASNQKNLDQELNFLELNNLIFNYNQEKFIENSLFKKLSDLISNDEIILKFKGFKILLEGKPGTGKTTLIKNLAKQNQKKLYIVSASSIVSPKLGQTQKNIDDLFLEIKKVFPNSIILIDEFDSLIGSRDMDINNEYHRMIGTFNNALDNLSHGSILVAISNKMDFIDKSTIRRFNLKINIDEIDLDKIIELLKYEAARFGLEFNQEIAKKMLKIKIKELNYSLAEEVIIKSFLEAKNINEIIKEILNLSDDDLQKNGFSLRELESITGTSKSTLQRKIKKEKKI